MIEKITPDDYETVKNLFREYQNFLGFSLCFQGFDKELAEFPGVYAEPTGTVLKATQNGEIVGVVALKPLSADTCEMKRLYVVDSAKGLGLGKALATAVMDAAKAKNYQTMKLDTLKRLTAAVNLYHKLGFQPTEPYNYNPDAEVIYFEKNL